MPSGKALKRNLCENGYCAACAIVHSGSQHAPTQHVIMYLMSSERLRIYNISESIFKAALTVCIHPVPFLCFSPFHSTLGRMQTHDISWNMQIWNKKPQSRRRRRRGKGENLHHQHKIQVNNFFADAPDKNRIE